MRWSTTQPPSLQSIIWVTVKKQASGLGELEPHPPRLEQRKSPHLGKGGRASQNRLTALPSWEN